MPRSWELGAAEIEALAAAPAPALRTLRLPLADAGAFAALTEAPLLASVTALAVSDCSLDAATVNRLARSPHAGNLLRLNLPQCNIGPKGVQALAEAPFAANLVALNLSRNQIRKAGVQALLAPGRFPRLKQLTLYDSVRLKAEKEQFRERFGSAVRL